MRSVQYFLASAIHTAPSADNSQPWKISFKNNTLKIQYDIDRVSDKTFPADNPATLLAMGAALHNLQQAAESLSLNVAYEIPVKQDAANPVYVSAALPGLEACKACINNQLPLFKRHTNRGIFKSSSLPIEVISLLNKLTLSSARVLTINNSQDISNVAQLVREASEIRFQTKEVHEWLGKSLRFESADTNDGLDVQTLGLPPGGKLILHLIKSWKRMRFLNKLGAYKMLSLIDSAPIKQAPCLVTIIAPSGFRDIMDAGQLMNQVWIELNNKGIAVHPYYVISDQLHRLQADIIPTELKSQAELIQNSANKTFQLKEGETLQMLFRVGYPKKTPTLSKRLPLETVCSGIELNSED